ncbi:MAG TPA: glycosyl hydrolase [Solirubrobacterales bacterium]
MVGAFTAIFFLIVGIALAHSGEVSRERAHFDRVGIAEARSLAGRHLLAAGAQQPQPQPLYWGATIGDQITGSQAPWDMSAVSKFENLAQKQASLVQFFQPFAECSGACTFDYFPTTPMESIRHHGSIPVLSWSSQSIPTSMQEPEFQLSDIVEGHFDTFLRRFATEAREWGRPFFLRFNWEMNGNWFPWSEGVNGNGPGEYVAAWRHVHDIFSEVGASNVTWVWCPFIDPSGSLRRLSSLYPGESYVDWIGLDGYNWGTNPSSPRGWRSFGQLFAGTYRELTELAPGKPLMIAEVGSSEDGGSKSHWIREALAAVPAEYPQVRAFLWFDKYDDGMDWPIETSASATTAFAEGIKSSAYVGASYGNLGGGPIQPPG